MNIPFVNQFVNVAGKVADTALNTLEHLLERLTGGGGSPANSDAPPRPQRPATDTPGRPTPSRPAPRSQPAPPPVAPEPAHIEEEVELVGTSADAGAQDSPGPNIRVDEPWPGYRVMTAPEVSDRLVVADAATLAAVKLYESSHRKRKMVVTEVDRRLASVSGGSQT
jgi:hypothetical protein